MTLQEQADAVDALLSGLPACQWGEQSVIRYYPKCDRLAEWHVDFGAGQALCATHAKLATGSIMTKFTHIRSGQVVSPEPFEYGYQLSKRLLAVADSFANGSTS